MYTPRFVKSAVAGLIAFVLLAFAAPAFADYSTGLEKKSFADVQTAAEAGDGMAQLELGHRYYYEKRYKDDVKALHWFEKAAQQGVPWAEYETGVMYMSGEGAAADPQKALVWYKKAAADGVMVANFDIGVVYWQGEGVPKDSVEAIKWLTIAANGGEPRAPYVLGLIYRDGDGVPADSTLAIKWFKVAVGAKSVEAAEALEKMYADGTGVTRDPIVSHAWRTMAAYLRNRDKAPPIPKGATAVGFFLMTPKLSQDDNMKAFQLYMGFMEELGLSKPDKK